MEKIVLIVTFFALLACSDDDSNSGSQKSQEIDIVTGITITDELGVKISEFGNPNTLSEKILVYPNPPFESLKIDSFEKIEAIWLVSAEKSTQFMNVDFSSILNSNLYTEADIDVIAEIKFNKDNEVLDTENEEVSEAEEDNALPVMDFASENTVVDNLLINVSELSDGYYRVFVKTATGIYWDNIYVSEIEVINSQDGYDFFENEF